MTSIHAILAACLLVAASAAPADDAPKGGTSRPMDARPCHQPPADPRPLVDAPPDALMLTLRIRRPMFESTITRSGVWDGALVFDDRGAVETRLWWQNLTAKDYDSVLFEPGTAGTYSRLESQPSAYGVTFRFRL